MTGFGKLLVAALALIVAALAYWLWLLPRNPVPIGGEGSTTTTPQYREHASRAMGIAFRYPESYVIDERVAGTPQRKRQSIVLIRSADLPLPANGEGPTAITIDAFQNDLDKYTALEWITGSSDSNYKLSTDGAISTSTLAGEEALSFRWSGLYEGRTAVVAGPGWIYAFSVTHLTPEDGIIGDFGRLLESIRFTQ